MTTAAGYDAVVLAGGSARRLDGADKPGLRVGGTPMLDRVLAACGGAGRTVVVGPERATARPVRWVREQPPGGGPVAAIAAALPQVTAGTVLLLAADLPFFDAATAARLCAALTPAATAAVLVDRDGRDQPLAAAYRTDALREALTLLPDPSGLPLRRLVGGLPTTRLPDLNGVATDCDTWTDLAHARARAEQPSTD